MEEKLHHVTFTEQDNGEKLCAIKQSLIPWLRRYWALWNW
jgi:hypothetical protein